MAASLPAEAAASCSRIAHPGASCQLFGAEATEASPGTAPSSPPETAPACEPSQPKGASAARISVHHALPTAGKMFMDISRYAVPAKSGQSNRGGMHADYWDIGAPPWAHQLRVLIHEKRTIAFG